MEIGGDLGPACLVLLGRWLVRTRDFERHGRRLQRKLEVRLDLRTRGTARLFPGRADRRMVRVKAFRSLQRLRRRLLVPEDRMCARFPRPRLHRVRLEGEDFVEALQGLAGSIAFQENFPLREPRPDEIPFERDRAVVILDRGPPSALPLEELALAEDDRRVLRILPRAWVKRASAASVSPNPRNESPSPRTARTSAGLTSRMAWNRMTASFACPSLRSCSAFRAMSPAFVGSSRKASRNASPASASRPRPNRRLPRSNHARRFARSWSRTRR